MARLSSSRGGPGGGDFKRHDKDTHDRHGVPRCQHCGAPTGFVRFSPGDLSKPDEHRKPRLWVRCMAGATDACTKTQTIACSSDYRMLVPLWRTDPLYHELKESHSTYEAQHDWWRDRYKVAADDLAVPPQDPRHRLAPAARQRRRARRLASHLLPRRLARQANTALKTEPRRPRRVASPPFSRDRSAAGDDPWAAAGVFTAVLADNALEAAQNHESSARRPLP
jgi:hypothetical protein